MTGIPVAQVTILRGISNGICIDCGAEVPKPARGPTAKRCPECQAKHRRPAVKPGVVFT
jgi:RNA polymerase-binding transcription factor DksA